MQDSDAGRGYSAGGRTVGMVTAEVAAGTQKSKRSAAAGIEDNLSKTAVEGSGRKPVEQEGVGDKERMYIVVGAGEEEGGG
jgi:hypothetical protein